MNQSVVVVVVVVTAAHVTFEMSVCNSPWRRDPSSPNATTVGVVDDEGDRNTDVKVWSDGGDTSVQVSVADDAEFVAKPRTARPPDPTNRT